LESLEKENENLKAQLQDTLLNGPKEKENFTSTANNE